MSVPPNGDAGSSISSSQLFLQFVNFFQTVLLTSLRRRKNFHNGAILFLKGRRSDATVVLKNWQTVFFDDKVNALARKSLWQRLSGAGYWKTFRAIMKWAQSIQKPVFATIQYFILLSLSLSLSLDCSSLSNRTRAVSLLNSRRYENDVILLLEWLDSISTIKTLERNQTSAPTAAHAATTTTAVQQQQQRQQQQHIQQHPMKQQKQ